MSTDSDLLVVGAGAKGAAVAMKVHVLNSLGLGPIALTLVEATAPAAAWMDGNGVTSSRETLAISPSKDLGFPYEGRHCFGAAGAAVDREAMAFSWQRHLIESGRYAAWIDAGSPPVQRRVYGAYIGWVLARATRGVRLIRGRVEGVSLSPDGEGWTLDVASESGARRYGARAFALTGPGLHREISHDRAASSRVLDCDSGRMEIAAAPVRESSDIAIVGGGESALSCLELARALRPDARVTLYTPGLPMSRVESFLENRAFSNPDAVSWSSLSLRTRREFIRRSDRGVFGPERIAAFAYDERCSFVAGRVLHVSCLHGGRGVCVEHESAGGVAQASHDYVINCTGFDLLEHLRSLMSADARAEVERRVGQVWDRPPDSEIATGRNLELKGLRPRLHLPGLAGLSQGPGFANLGSLGLLADRVLEPLVDGARSARSAGESGAVVADLDRGARERRVSAAAPGG